MDTRNARARAHLTLAVLAVSAVLSSGCLVLTLHPAYDDRTVVWDEGLLGEWRDEEDNIQATVERSEWRSYRIRFARPSETADFTGHLTAIGDQYFLDLMPERGVDYGPVLVPAHLILRVTRAGDGWEVAGLDYEALRRDAAAERHVGGGSSALDQRHNVLLTASTPELRQWLRAGAARVFGAPVVFERVSK